MQHSDRPKDFIIGKTVNLILGQQFVVERNQQFDVFVFIAANNAHRVDELEAYREVCQRAATFQQRFHRVFDGVVIFAKGLKNQQVYGFGQ